MINVLHESNWVHRDISLNNVLLDADGHARLIDFEFAKKSGNEDIPETPIVCDVSRLLLFSNLTGCCQGTPAFMAIEVHKRRYSFRPNKLLERLKEMRKKAAVRSATEATALAGTDGVSSFRDDPGLAPPPYPPFCYRPLHDWESLWWLIALLLFQWDAKGEPEDVSDAAEAKRRYVRKDTYTRIFGDSYDRTRVIADDGFFYWMLDSLRPRTQQAGLVLEELRKQLVARYTASEQDWDSSTKPAFDGLQDDFAKALQDVCAVLTAA